MKKIFLLTLIIAISSCSGIESKKIKLKDYQKVTQKDLKMLSIEYEGFNPVPSNSLNYSISPKFDSLGVLSKKRKKGRAKCKIQFVSSYYNSFSTCPIITNAIAPLTLFIIPYYCQYKYNAKATLLKRSPTNPQTYTTLKTYQLNDKVHELWSLILYLPPVLFFGDHKSPETAKSNTNYRISEALVRQTLNDALNHKECYKNEADYYKYKQKTNP